MSRIDLSQFKAVKLSSFKTGKDIFATVSKHPRIDFNIRFSEICESTRWRVMEEPTHTKIAIIFLPNDTKEQGIAKIRKIGKNTTHAFQEDFIKMFKSLIDYKEGDEPKRIYGTYYPEDHCVIFDKKKERSPYYAKKKQ